MTIDVAGWLSAEQQLYRDCRQAGEEQHQQCVRPANHVQWQVAALCSEAADVGGQAELVQICQVRSQPLAELHFAHQQLGEVEAEGRVAPEREVDEDEVIGPVSRDEQVAWARIAMGRAERDRVQLLQVCRQSLCCEEQACPERWAEGLGYERVRPERLGVQRGQDLALDPAVRVAADDVLHAPAGHGCNGGSGSEASEPVGGALEGRPVPRRRVGVDGLEPEASRALITSDRWELTEVVEELLVASVLGVPVSVSLVEAACIDVVAVDVDLTHLATASADDVLGRPEKHGSEAQVPAIRCYV